MAWTWLHISDLHVKVGDSYDRDVVLRSLIAEVRRDRESGRLVDVVFATGDIAHSGKALEYEIASRFFDDLLAAAGLGRERLFVVPGNHDVDREAGIGLARSLDSREDADAYFAADRDLPHLVYKQKPFLEWYERYFDGIRPRPVSSCAPPEIVDLGGARIGVLTINSALFCQDDNDHDKLWIGRRALDCPARSLRDADVDLRVVLLHHPLDWLAGSERSNVSSTLAECSDVVLRGHLHETDVAHVLGPQGDLLQIAVGAAYQTRQWPNGALYVTCTDHEFHVFPIRYEDSPTEMWTVDPTVYPHRPGFVGRIERQQTLPTTVAAPALPPTADGLRPDLFAEAARGRSKRFLSNVASRRGLRVVGRDRELDELDRALGPVVGDEVMVLAGPPGVGKSELAREYARRQAERYPGGTFVVDATGAGALVDLTRIAATYIGIELPGSLTVEEQCAYALAAAGSDPVLLIYDGVESFDAIERWLPPAGMPCHVIITSIPEPRSPGWRVISVEPLTQESAVELVAVLGGQSVALAHGELLARWCAGLPVELCPLAAALGDDFRRGRVRDMDMAQLSEETHQSFGLVYDRLPSRAQLLLHVATGFNWQRISVPALQAQLSDVLEWSERDTIEAIDACIELQLLRGNPESEVMMHQLLATHLILSAPSQQSAFGRDLPDVRSHQRAALLAAAGAVCEDPADFSHVTKLTSFELTPTLWHTPEGPLAGTELHTIGFALNQIGRFAQARPFGERAVREKSRRDDDNRVDHASLGSSHHLVGYCYSRLGEYEVARPFYEQAVEEKRRGDVQGRVDHESLGASLHQVGNCCSQLGHYELACSYGEQAVKEQRKGDLHGRVDHESVSGSLHQVGDCYAQLERYEMARTFYEQAVEESRKGDVHGRVDHDGLGSSLHQVGYCYSRLGEYELARPFYEQAVEKKRRGDIHRRIDHQSLGASLHQVGNCFAQLDEYDPGRSFGEQAVDEKRHGDVYGRVDHRSLGASLHLVGYCYSGLGEREMARPFYEQAIEEKRRGDVHGRVDEESLRVSYLAGAECLRTLGESNLADEWELMAKPSAD